MVNTVNQIFIDIIILYTIEWSLDFGQDSVSLTVKGLVQEMIISSLEHRLAAWSLLLSQRQQFLNNHRARVPVTPNRQGTHEMRDEVISSVGAQDMDTSGHQVSADLDDVEFYWENIRLDVDAVFRQGIDTPFHQQRLTTWRWEVRQKTPFCWTKRKTKRIVLQQQHQSLRDQQDPSIA